MRYFVTVVNILIHQAQVVAIITVAVRVQLKREGVSMWSDFCLSSSIMPLAPERA